MKSILLHLAALSFASVPVSALTVGFEDLPFPPAPDGTTGLQYATASGDGSLYSGIVWDSRVIVVGSQYRVDTATPGPLFGLPHSGDHFITNETSGDGGNGITLATTMVLTGGWFGQVEYYGFGGGADAITIHALNGSTSLGFVTFTLPDVVSGQPEALSFVDTSSFTALSGITGYRIDHHAPVPSADNWVADDLRFAPVPEPRAMALATGLLMVGFAAWRRCSR